MDQQSNSSSYEARPLLLCILLLTTIASAVLVVGYGCNPNNSGGLNYSGNYSFEFNDITFKLELKSDGSLTLTPEKSSQIAIGFWEVEGDLLICKGSLKVNKGEKTLFSFFSNLMKKTEEIVIKFNKENLMVTSIADNISGQKQIPIGVDAIYVKKE